MLWAPILCLWPSPTWLPSPSMKKDLRKHLDKETLVRHWFSKVSFSTNAGFNNIRNHRTASQFITDREAWKTVIKKQTKAFPSCRTLAIFIYLFKKYRLNAYSRPGTKCSECTFKGTDKSPLIWPSRCTVFYVGVHPTQHPAISTSGKTAMLAFSMYTVPSRLCSPWKPN